MFHSLNFFNILSHYIWKYCWIKALSYFMDTCWQAVKGNNSNKKILLLFITVNLTLCLIHNLNIIQHSDINCQITLRNSAYHGKSVINNQDFENLYNWISRFKNKSELSYIMHLKLFINYVCWVLMLCDSVKIMC